MLHLPVILMWHTKVYFENKTKQKIIIKKCEPSVIHKIERKEGEVEEAYPK